MNSNRTLKDSKKENVLVEVSSKPNIPQIIVSLTENLRGQSIPLKKSNIPPHQINLYFIAERKDANFENVQLTEVVGELKHVLTIIYMDDKTEKMTSLPRKPTNRTLLLREDLDPFYSLDFEVENVASKQESLVHLCNLVTAYSNYDSSKELNFFDQKTESIAKLKDSSSSPLEVIWTNILYQIPGVGPEKAIQISQAFPTYSSILEDSKGSRKLKKLEIEGKGGKKMKLGKQISERIYKVMTSTMHFEPVM